MTDHDPLCPQHLQYPGHRSRCICVLLREADARARADERAAALEFCCADTEPDIRRAVAEEIAQAILDRCNDTPNGPCGRCARAAEIARRHGGAQ